MTRVMWAITAGSCALFAGCASKPPAEVSRSDLTAVRQSHSSAKVGDAKQTVLDSYKAGNKVKLGSSVLDGSVIEEWKVEAFTDENKRKDIFVTFLYFCNDRFVDSSDTRIDFRNNDALVSRWKASAPR